VSFPDFRKRPTGRSSKYGGDFPGKFAKARPQSLPCDLPGTMGLPEAGKFHCSELAAWSVGMEVDREARANLHAGLEFGVVLFDSASRSEKWLGRLALRHHCSIRVNSWLFPHLDHEWQHRGQPNGRGP
jgi:hypothetical protein